MLSAEIEKGGQEVEIAWSSTIAATTRNDRVARPRGINVALPLRMIATFLPVHISRNTHKEVSSSIVLREEVVCGQNRKGLSRHE